MRETRRAPLAAMGRKRQEREYQETALTDTYMFVIHNSQIEAAWANLPRNEQERIFTELQELQKKDWKELSLDEKKAGKWRAFMEVV